MKNNQGNFLSQYRGLSKSAYVIFISRLITNMGAFIWPLLTLILSRKMGYSASEIALMSLGIGFVMLPATIIGGKLADKYNRKKLIIILDSLSILFFISCAFLEPGNIMLIFFVLAGLFANMEGPAYEAIVADATKPHEREKVYSLSYLGHNLGYIVGAAIGGFLFENYLNLAFVIDGLTTMTSTILIILFVKVINISEYDDSEKNEYENHETESSTFKILKDRKSVLIQMIVFMFGSFIYGQWTFALPLYMEKLYLEDGAKYFGLVSSFNGAIVIIFTPIMTRVLFKMLELRKVFFGILLYSLSYLIIIKAQAYWIFFIMMFFFTLGEIINMLGSSPYISRRIPASHRGRINSIRNIGYFIGGVGGQYIIGLIIDHYSYTLAFITLGFVGIFVSIVVFFNQKIDKLIFPNLYKLPKMTEIEPELDCKTSNI